jgi:hypothetical protein
MANLELTIDSSGPLDEGWDVDWPDGYEVELSEPLGKSAETFLGFATADLWTIVLVLKEVGLIEWVASKSYDALWAYLRAMAASKLLRPHASIKIEQEGKAGRVSVAIEGLSEPNIERARVVVRQKVTKTSASCEIEIDIKSEDG